MKCETGVRSLIGNGVTIQPSALLEDFNVLDKNGIRLNKNKLVISDRANLVTHFHKEVAEKLSNARGDSRHKDILGQDVSNAFKPLKLAIRISELVMDWKIFED